MIIKKLGKPKDLYFLEKSQVGFIHEVSKGISTCDETNIFSNQASDSPLFGILQGMLQFNPYDRLTA